MRMRGLVGITPRHALKCAVFNGSGNSVQTTSWSRREKFDEFRAGANYKF